MFPVKKNAMKILGGAISKQTQSQNGGYYGILQNGNFHAKKND
jgi:hypothetical protein